MFTPPLRHWYVKPVPVAVTLNVTDSATHFVALDGFPEIDGGVFTVSVTELDVTGEPQLPLTTTSYDPVSPDTTDGIV